MKTWSKTDLIGLAFSLLGFICLIFANSQILTITVFVIAVLNLLYSLYDARFDSARYRDILCHYQAILSATSDGWIAWNRNHEFINASKKFKEFFGFKGKSDIFFANIISLIEQDDVEELTLNFNKLQRTGQPFEKTVTTIDKKNLKILGAKILIEGLETTVLWGRDVTESSSLMDSIEDDLIKARVKVDCLYEILNALPLQVWKRNSDLDIIYCNKTYADSLDTTPDNVIFDNMPLVPGVILGQGHSLAENVKKCGKALSISQFAVIDGVRKKLSIHEQPALGDGYIGYALDITEKENLSDNLNKVITANWEVLENISTAIAIFGEDMRLIFFNSSYQHLMKLDSSWLHSKPTYGEILDERRNNRQLPEHADFQAFKKSQLAMFTSITAPFQDLMHLPNNKSLRMVVAPYPLGGLLFMYEDVTDSLTLQRKNNTLLAVQKETLDHLYEGVMVYGSDNRLKIINNSMLDIWNIEMSANELKGCHLIEILDKIKDLLDFGPDWKIFRENAVSNLTDRIAKKGKLMKKDGSTILFSYVPLPDGAHMHSFVDITDTCTIEKAIVEKNQALKTAQTLRFEFVSGISSEIKEPLNVLIGFAELLMHQYCGELNQKQVEYCRFILSAANQLNELIGNLLEMVSIDIDSIKLQYSSFSMQDTLSEVVESLQHRIKEKNIDIVSTYTPEDVIFRGDKVRIKQAVFNILINAIQFTPPNGQIDMRLTLDDNNIKIVVRDGSNVRGKGTPKTVFKRSSSKMVNFLSADANGISIPLVRSLIELHGGSLHVSSDIEGGTSVICTLPTHLEESVSEKVKDIPESSEIQKKVVNS